MFFQGNDPVHQTMQHVVEKLEQAGIPYAIVGAMAVNAHRYQRTTRDVDFLLSGEGLTAFVRLFGSNDFQPVPERPRRFRDPATGVTFDILVTGLFPGSGKPGPVAFPDPAAVSEVIKQKRVITLAALIELKLAARRYKDFGDVVELIRIHQLDESYAVNFHSSVRGDYIECLQEMRREDEYEIRQDRAFEEKVRGSASQDPPP